MGIVTPKVRSEIKKPSFICCDIGLQREKVSISYEDCRMMEKQVFFLRLCDEDF